MRWIVYTLILIFLSGCISYRRLKALNIKYEDFGIRIIAENLSEDFSPIASQDDELVVLVFSALENGEIGELKVKEELLFNKGELARNVRLSQEMIGGKYIVVVLEQDTDASADHLGVLVKKYYAELLALYNKHDHWNVEEYIGDDDLLGIWQIEYLKNGISTEFSGMHKLDRFEYILKVGSR